MCKSNVKEKKKKTFKSNYAVKCPRFLGKKKGTKYVHVKSRLGYLRNKAMLMTILYQQSRRETGKKVR